MSRKRLPLLIVSRRAKWRARLAVLVAVSLAVGSGGCFTGEVGEPYYGRVVVPRGQEFRWSDGGLPQIFDPALAAAPPDTDAVRALYEGLTDYEPRTLAAAPGVALSWESSADYRRWTFRLRPDARWSNGEPVTAQDFVNSWRRTARFGERAPHAKLLHDIVGARQEISTASLAVSAQANAASITGEGSDRETATPTPIATPARPEPFGAEALDARTLRVTLRRPMEKFPALVAHPVFRPIHSSQLESETAAGDQFTSLAEDSGRDRTGTPTPITNGAFQLSRQAAAEGVVLERAGNYWNAKTVALERVRFVATRGVEESLAAYRAGEVDAVTNTSVEPLAIKLLTPHQDFRRSTFGAITYYQFNTASPPFDDLRVRQALTLAIDRERLSMDTLKGATVPAERFLPVQDVAEISSAAPAPLSHDAGRARQLLAEAGYPGGEGFPVIRLVINRNDQHRLVAQAVAAMWRNVLGVGTEVIIKNWDEYEATIAAGDFDIARRSVVMQTTDEEMTLLTMFPPPELAAREEQTNAGDRLQPAASPESASAATDAESADAGPGPELPQSKPPILTEAQALAELPAMPVYFASSFALVKPYVNGFDSNLLDAHCLQHVRIDTNWRAPQSNATIRLARGK